MRLVEQAAVFLLTVVIVVPLFQRFRLGAVLGYLVAGIGFAMSSTALVLATLGERNELSTPHGRDTFAVLLFQDLAVIPTLALLPLLAGAASHGGGNLVLALKGVLAIVIVVAIGRIAVRPVLRFIAAYGSREVFTAASLLLVVGAALVMRRLGLSMSLGAFLAGVMLADSEFRHELEADIEPFKGLLMGLFFMAVGMSADLSLVVEQPLVVLGCAVALMAAKLALAYVVARLARRTPGDALELSVLLAEGGEFAFVLFATAASLAVLDAATSALLVMVVTVSMLLAPALFAVHRRALARWRERSEPPEFDTIDEPGNPVIIAGYGRFGQIVSRVLRMCGIAFTALDANYQQVDFVRRFGNKIYYGDATRLELLHAAKAGDAKLFVLAIDDVDASVRAAALVRRHFPALPILARARNRVHYFRLRDLGIRSIYRETFPASLEVAHQALLKLGMSVSLAQHAVALFRAHDVEQLEAQYAVHQDEDQLIQSTRQAAEQLKELFESDAAHAPATAGDEPRGPVRRRGRRESA
jgi:glutathione-regulated potassium-efflux system ancillary protein KefC/glutathione-regulated potassium-efflux system protein KefB